MIPDSFISDFDNSSNSNNDDSKIKKPLPIENANYKEICDQNYYVDKTLIIKDIIDEGVKGNLFTRLRRFGKTLTMD